jgi:hypothetical protein
MRESFGMVKLIYSSAYDSTVDVGMRLIEDPARLDKSASDIFGCPDIELLPDKDHVGIHLVALGDFEHYGSNRNGDGFPKKACVKYHDTFVKHGHLYRHHRNKDPEKSLGGVVKSAYNAPMGRIELFVHAHKDKAQDELHKLATDGDIPFSMACKVAFDRCSVCGTLRRSSKDPNQCDHVATQLGKIAEDGKVICTHNDEPKFFDISFVTRPADRIAWHLKAASDGLLDSVKMAEVEGIWVPDHLAIVSADAQAKRAILTKLAEMEVRFAELSDYRRCTPTERYQWELRKAATGRLDDDTIVALRKYEPEDVLYKLAKAGIVLDVDSFFKYAMGSDYGEIAPFMDEVRSTVKGIYTRLDKSGACQNACNETAYDVDVTRYDAPVNELSPKVAAAATFIGPAMEQRIIDTTINKNEITLDSDYEKGSNCNLTVNGLCEKYAAYKLAAIRAIESFDKNTDTDTLVAIATAQNLVR